MKEGDEQKTVISQSVSNTRKVDVCHFCGTPHCVRRITVNRIRESFLANDGIDRAGALYFYKKMVWSADDPLSG